MMYKLVCSLVLGCLLLAPASAAAQDSGSDQPPPPPTIEEIERGEAEEPEAEEPEAEEPEAEADSETDSEAERAERPSSDVDPAGWDLLERAVEHLARGESTQAHRLLEQIADEYADHPAAALSADALAVLRDKSDKQPDSAAPDAAESATTAARAELAFFQTMHGLALGGELCIIAECDDPKAVVALLGVGAGIGLGASLGLSSDGITPGHALLLNSGTTWGFANGLMLSIALDTEFQEATAITAVGQLAGLATSSLLWNELQPTSGQVSMANSGGFWAGWLAFWAHGVNDFDADGQTIATTMLIAADLGILGGALLAREQPMSRGRTFVIDSGGILGLLAGMGIYVFADADMSSATGFSLMTIGGTAAGLGTATYLTRDWDAPDDPDLSANWAITPTDGGAQLSVGGRF
ncbi:MAG: hypothetical protein ACLFVJ_17065 [Persicimonas sp.]